MPLDADGPGRLTVALAGALLAGAFIVFGLLRFLLALGVALVGGSHQHFSGPTWQDIRPLAFYVLGFGLAGALVGLLKPWLRRAAAFYAAMAVGGIIVMAMIMASDKGLAAADRPDWIFIVLTGCLFGGAAAWGVRRGARNAGAL